MRSVKFRLTFAMCAVLLACFATSERGQGTIQKDPNPKPVLLTLDLITDGIREIDLYNGKLEIAVRNIGKL